MVVRRDKYKIRQGRGLGICPCGKRNYRTRREAKAAGKRVGLEEGRQRERGPINGYRCDESGNFHWGHDRYRQEDAVDETRRAQSKLVAMVAAASSTSREGDDMKTTMEAPKSSPASMPRHAPGAMVPSASLKTVTPEMAANWLAQNTHNRKLREQLVSQYARDMAAGKWELNGETIQIAGSGLLLNGQHRLNAVVEAGVPVMMFIVTGLPDDAQDTIDTGVKRGLADILTLNSYDRGKDLAAVARLSVQVKAGTNHVRPSDTELREIIDNDETLRWVVSNVLNDLPNQLASRTLMAYAYRVLHEISPDDCATFFSKLKTLENLPQGSPILALNRRLSLMERRVASWSDRSYVLTSIYLAWNAYRKGTELKMIKPYPSGNGTFSIPRPV